MLTFWLSGLAPGFAADLSVCVPYSVPVAETIQPCGLGLVGSKYKIRYKTCPSGEITTSAEFDTSTCLAASSPVGSVNNTNKCLVTPDACAPAIVTSNCSADSRWTLEGSGIAHCVKNDPVCAWGTSLTHDLLGNPSCAQNTCSSGQVLQSDGKSCACPSSMVMQGGVCTTAAPPSCVPETDQRKRTVCRTGYSGYTLQERLTSCPNGPYGRPFVGEWIQIESHCERDRGEPTPPAGTVTCYTGATIEYSNCPTGSGRMNRYVQTTCPSGSYGNPSVVYDPWNTSNCAAGTTAPSTPAPTCSNGATNYPTCTLPKCTNGATNYPTCTPPPPPVTCSGPTSSTATASCGSGFTGSVTTVTTRQCNGTSTQEVRDNCVPIPVQCGGPTTTSSTGSCGSGLSGTKTIVTTTQCNGSASSQTIDNCSCANGSTEYPRCPPPPPPPVITTPRCTEGDRIVVSGTACGGRSLVERVEDRHYETCELNGNYTEKYMYTTNRGERRCDDGSIVWQ